MQAKTASNRIRCNNLYRIEASKYTPVNKGILEWHGDIYYRLGKSRPWFLFGAIPFALSAFLAFTVPDISPEGKLAYAYATYIFLSFMYAVCRSRE